MGIRATLHLWWARRPLAAARAVIFAQMVDDPSEYVDTLKSRPEAAAAGGGHPEGAAQAVGGGHGAAGKGARGGHQRAGAGAGAEARRHPRRDRAAAALPHHRGTRAVGEHHQRRRAARRRARRSGRAGGATCAENAGHPRAKELFDRHKLPAFHDPFAGGGALPLEAQRLGLEAYASDLNPVAVLINKAMIEIPPKFAGRPPVNPEARKGQLGTKTWRGAQGLAEDVRYYGQWMRDEAEKRIGHLYPEDRDHRRDGAGAARPETARRPQAHRHRLALGAHGEKPEPGVSRTWTCRSPPPSCCRTKAGQGGLGRARRSRASGYRFEVQVGKPQDAEAAKSGHEARARSELPLSDVGHTHCAATTSRAEGKAGTHGRAADGHRCRRRSRAGLSRADSRSMKLARRCAKPDVEARRSDCQGRTRVHSESGATA